MSSAFTSGVTPESTTAKMAGEVPKESSKEFTNEATGTQAVSSSDIPGTFPETPANEASAFSVNPIPASSGHGNPIDLQPDEKVPDPSTFNSNTVSSTVKDDPSLAKSDEPEKSFGVAPLPAAGGFGNPTHLEPGEKVPHPSEFTSNTIDSHVTTDKESYEKGSIAPQLPDVVTPQRERDVNEASMFSVPGITKNTIPESSLPMGESIPAEKDQGAVIQSAGADSTTAALAGAVPKEATSVPQIVQESQAEAGTDAEAGQNEQAVAEKSRVEKELESKVPEAAATSEGVAGGNTDTSAVGGASLGSHALPPSIQQSIDEINKGSAIAPTVPDVVQESIAQSHVSPEAAGDKTMVEEKSAMESELLKKVPTENALGEPAPVVSAALSESAPAPTGTETVIPAAASSQAPATTTMQDDFSSAATPSNEASTTAPPSTETSAVLSGSPTDSTTSSSALKGAKSFPTKSSAPPPTISEPAATSDAPMTTAAAPAATPATEQAARKSNDYSRDVSPMTKTDQQAKPVVTTGLGSSTAPEISQSTPPQAAASPTSATSTSTDKKSKRASGFFGKLKAKFSDKDKDKK